MIVYIYDGSFEGLLTSIYEAFYSKDKPERILRQEEFIQDLISFPVIITTDPIKSNKVYDAIIKKISQESLKYIFYVYLSEIYDSGTLIYSYIKMGFKKGREIDLYLHEDTVLNMHKLSNKVTLEAHRMLGFVRFKTIGNNLYYSPIEPDHNITGILAPHFAARLSCQNWIIHDLKREIAAMYNMESWVVSYFPKESYEKFCTEGEGEVYKNLWKDYFNYTTIANRKNPKYQKRSMPVRYWKHLSETM